MKSVRLNSVALSWLQGGHHLAPQYKSTGFFSALASAKMASISLSCAAAFQATPAGMSMDAWAGAKARLRASARLASKGDLFMVGTCKRGADCEPRRNPLRTQV